MSERASVHDDPEVQRFLDALTDDLRSALDEPERMENRDLTPPARDTLTKLRLVARIASLHGAERHESVSTVEPGAVWGHLQILAKVGGGAYGDVYRARDTRLDRIVALKLLHDDLHPPGAETIEEGRLLARLRHPNIVTVYGAERVDGHTGIWMEFLDGPTLEDELAQRGPFPPDEVVRIGIDLARALGAAHQAGVLHRDLKPQNVMRGPGGRACLMDFGTGRDVARLGAGRQLVGSPRYLAPEVLNGEAASERSDLYSLGILLHRLATGCFPTEAGSIAELREPTAKPRLAPRRKGAPRLLLQVASVIDRATSIDPVHRYGSADAMAAALSAVAPRIRGRRRMMVAICAALMLVVAVPLLLQVNSRQSADTEPMADVTSSSRRARQLYSQAAALMTGDGPWNTVGAEQFLRDALREDPVFPSARTLTAWVLYNQRRPPQEYLPYAEDADRSAAALPDAERYFIVGSAHHLRALATEDAVLRRQELAKAAGAYEAVLRTQPEHPWALTNIQYLFTRLADPVAEQPVVERLAAVRPDTFSVNVRALWLALLAGDERRAEPFATRCHELLAAGASHDADGASLVRVFVAQRAWLRNEAEEALRAADAVLPVLGDLSGVERVRLGDHLADLYLSLGATTRARQVAAMLPEDDSYARERITAAILWQRGDEPQLKRHLVRLFQNPSAAWRLTSMFIDVGLLDAARALLQHQQDRGTQRTFLEHGQLRLRLATSPSPDPSEIQRLADALHARSGFDFRPRDFGLALQLSAILDARGDSVQAIQLLEKLSTRRTAATAYAAGHLWMDVRVRLGELYHRSGRNGDAHAVEAELLRLLAAGDADRPRLSALQRHDHLR